MRFLHSSWGRLLLPITLTGLFFNISSIRAAEPANQGAADANDVDLAKVLADARVIYVSSGPKTGAFQAIDDNRRTVFQFSSSDPRPTVIVRLTESKPIHRVSVVPGSQSPRVDVYLLNELPRDLADLDKIKPLTSIVDLVVGKEAAVDFAPQEGRYVALRWTLSTAAVGPLSIAEISAFTKPDASPISAALAATDPPVSLVMGPPVITPVSP
jgi:hypothetical protein